MATTTLQLITPKYYREVFNVCDKTARAWYNEDLEIIGRKRLTHIQFSALYEGLQPLQLPQDKKPKKAQKLPKKGK